MFEIFRDFLAVVAGLFLMAIAAGQVMGAMAHVLDRMGRLRDQRERLLRKDAIRNLGSDLSALAHWFTEDVGAWTAMRTLGDHLLKHGDIDVSGLRDEWRLDFSQERQKAGVDK